MGWEGGWGGLSIWLGALVAFFEGSEEYLTVTSTETEIGRAWKWNVDDMMNKLHLLLG